MSARPRETSLTDIHDALARIPAEDREVWVTVGMALKSELGDAGYDIWDDWSQTSDRYRAKDAADVWRSFKGGSIGIRTLFYLGRQHGYAGGPQRRTQSPRRTTVAYALEVWLQADRADSAVRGHPYAVKKDIESAGGAGRGVANGKIIGSSADCIIVPVRNLQTEKVQGVQCINAAGAKQTFGGLFGGGLVLGNTLDKRIAWFVTEGWASAYSMVFHHLRGDAVAAVAFGKGNMQRVAQSIADRYQPDAVTILREVDG